jgi:hypothetical protein
MNRRIVRPAVTLTALSAFALTSCSGGGGGGEEEDEPQGPPTLSDIDDAMWDAMESADSVTIEGDMGEIGEGEDFQEFLGDSGTLSVSGAMDGSFTVISGDGEPLMMMIGDEAFVDGAITASLAAAPMGDAIDTDQLEQELEGKWLDLSSEMGSDDEIDLGEMIADGRETWEEGAEEDDSEGDDSDSDDSDSDESNGDSSSSSSDENPFNSSSLEEEGTEEERDGESVWAYSDDEGNELAVRADEDAPYAVEVTNDGTTARFTEWNEVDEPERPADDDVMDQQDLESLLMDLMTESQ